MYINIQEFLEHADIKETLYPGKRIVKPCAQIGEYKNHCIVIDWRDPDTIRLDIKPGLNGQQLAPEITQQYPLCFQVPTSVKIKILNKNSTKTDDDDDEEETKGKDGGGGKKPAQKKKTLDEIELITSRFGESADGLIPALGEIKEMIVMGLQIAQESFTNTFAELTKQIAHAKIAITQILEKAVDIVTKVEPPSFMKPKGNETAQYTYDRNKNANIGFKMTLM